MRQIPNSNAQKIGVFLPLKSLGFLWGEGTNADLNTKGLRQSTLDHTAPTSCTNADLNTKGLRPRQRALPSGHLSTNADLNTKGLRQKQ